MSKNYLSELKETLNNPIDLETRTIESKDKIPVHIAFLRGLADSTPVTEILTGNNASSLTENTFTPSGKFFKSLVIFLFIFIYIAVL